MSQAGLAAFLAQVRGDPALQARLRRSSPVQAAAMAQELGHAVCCGDLIRYESRAFAWQLSDAEYELVARLQQARSHWWQRCWPPGCADPGTGDASTGSAEPSGACADRSDRT